MNKKLILLALPALLLSGCNKEISAADAKVKAKEIADHKVEIADIKAVSVAVDLSVDMSGNMGGASGVAKETETSTVEYAAEEKFVHVYAKFTSEEGTTEATKKYSGEQEAWYFIKDSKLTIATRTVDEDGKETKSKVEIPDVNGTAAKQFETATQKTLENLVKTLKSEETLTEVENIADGKAEEGAEYQVKYYTSGDGNLTVEGKATLTNYKYSMGGPEVTANGTSTVKYAWDQYLLNEATATMDLTAVDEASDTNVTIKVNTSAKANLNFKVAYPDLSDYQTGLGE